MKYSTPPRRTKDAFLWIVNILRKNKIPFLINGGEAARIYGTKRRLADIDLDIPRKNFSKLITQVKPFIKHRPKIYRDNHWRLFMMTLSYDNQLIDIGARENCFIFDHYRKKWVRMKEDFKKRKMMYVYGMRIPVEDEEELISDKLQLGRKVDKVDVERMIKARK
jgi:hypothetical protein